MNRKSMENRLSLLLLLGFALSAPLQAQVPVDENGQPLVAIEDLEYVGDATQAIPTMTATELEELVGPVALYPDDLLAIVLPASTYPLEIVQAARFLDEFEADSSLEPDESWDESVIALLNYPEVIRMLDQEIDWTWRLGEAVIAQQADVIAAVESFRDRAYAAGNLQSDEYQTVSNDDGVIEIDPVDEEIIYVPYYEPQEVVVYQPRRVYYYYPQAYPVYYYPYPLGYNFNSGHFWGVTTAYTIGWSNHYLNVHHASYWGHPYYGHHYYGHYYRRPSISLYNSWYVHNSYRSSAYHHRDGDHWRPRHRRAGARPATQSVRNHYYSSGSNDRDRDSSRSGGRTRPDIQDSNRTSGNRIRTSNSGNNGRTRIVAGNNRGTSDSSADRRSTGRTGTRDRTGVSNPNASRLVRGGNTSGRRHDAAGSGSGIRFRERGDANPVRANRSGSSRRDHGASSNRQRVTAQITRPTATGTESGQNRVSSRRNAPARQSTTTRTSYRNGVTQRPSSNRSTSQRPATRPAVQRQAPTQRPGSRPTVQRQAPVQRSAPAAAPSRQAAPRQAAPSSNHGQSGSKPQRRQSSSRGNSRPRQQH